MTEFEYSIHKITISKLTTKASVNSLVYTLTEHSLDLYSLKALCFLLKLHPSTIIPLRRRRLVNQALLTYMTELDKEDYKALVGAELNLTSTAFERAILAPWMHPSVAAFIITRTINDKL